MIRPELREITLEQLAAELQIPYKKVQTLCRKLKVPMIRREYERESSVLEVSIVLALLARLLPGGSGLDLSDPAAIPSDVVNAFEDDLPSLMLIGSVATVWCGSMDESKLLARVNKLAKALISRHANIVRGGGRPRGSPDKKPRTRRWYRKPPGVIDA